jgi:exonuclease III
LQELHHNYNGTGKAVDTYDPIAPYLMPRGHGGVAIMWKKTLDNFITPLTIGNERIQCVELSGKKNVILISVYLPCKGSDNHAYIYYME